MRVDGDEWYPVWSPGPECEFSPMIEVSEDLLERWRQALADFEATQREIGKLVEQAFK